MKTVILAGGRGTRLAEETDLKPKPMVEIGGIPILRHIMNRYEAYGFGDFVIALGYRGDQIEEYLEGSGLWAGNGANGRSPNGSDSRWRVAPVDTGLNTATGGRVRRRQQRLRRNDLGDETFMLTYGDGVADIDLGALVAFHRAHGRLATLTAVHPPPRFGALEIAGGGAVTAFAEKPLQNDSWVNGGFFVLEPAALDAIEGDATIWEQEPLRGLAERGELAAYGHDGFWQPMDTLREKTLLERLWASGEAPWKVWE